MLSHLSYSGMLGAQGSNLNPWASMAPALPVELVPKTMWRAGLGDPPCIRSYLASFPKREAGAHGFEPRYSESESDVLPLDDAPMNCASYY